MIFAAVCKLRSPQPPPSQSELSADRAHELRAEKADCLAQKLQAKEARIARQAINRARKQLRRAGIEARKQERLRKKRVAFYTNASLPIPLEWEDPIPDPEASESEGEEEYEIAGECGSERGSEDGSERGSQSDNSIE
ncbi:hypothetical protein VC83_08977 [Pseudogymnoascus destructans]|uniref:Uncharacterized protein n=1 Tax=Pseudogymnoascus destructans TaxID=655981 RepID=A0A177A199_9PEZI|nr:uncharacterized protein VC83_08977 [Pseudogymnoascus destructans]OAF54724.1 hypothetical protein VC83_08977 [Pseudogymnoascus destructans]